MKLRQKAKEGLAKMDDMGQMGNSEEAVVDDDEEYNAEVDALIDEFDPEAEYEMEFVKGGAVPDVRIPEAPKYDIPGFQQPRYRKGAVKSYEDLMGTAGILPKYETKQYIGPNNDIISVTFLNGQPVNPIPEGYRPYKGELVAPKIQAPTVIEDRGGGGDGRDDEPTSTEPTLGMTPNEVEDALATVNKDLAKVAGGRPKNIVDFFSKGVVGNVINAVQRGYYSNKALNQVRAGEGLSVKPTGEYGTWRNQMSKPMAAATLITEREAREIAGGKDLEGSSFGSKAEAEAVAKSGWGSDEHFDAIDKQFESNTRAPSSVPTSTEKATPAPDISITGTQIRGPEVDAKKAELAREAQREALGYDRESGSDRDEGAGSGLSSSEVEAATSDFAKGGLLAPRTPRKPKAKQTTSTRGKGLARKK
jgi:hypothetical protein